jgi:hypothetical protein
VREAPRVEEQRRPPVREARGHLVHDAHARTDEVVLGPVRDERQRDVVERQRERRPERAQERDLERGAGGEPGADRHVGGDERVEAAERHAFRERARAALRVVEPVAGARLFAEAPAPRGAVRERRAGDAHAAVVPERQLDRGALRDGGRQHEAAVVVRVLADQVDAAGRRGDRLGRPAEQRDERRHYPRSAPMQATSSPIRATVETVKIVLRSSRRSA